MIGSRRRASGIVTEQSQTLSFTRRAMVLGGAQIGIGALLAARMAWLSIAENERYKLLAESNRVQLMLIPPRRGWIIDRQGRPMAINRTDFRVDLIPDQLQEPDRVLAALERLLALPPDEMQRVREELARAAGYQPVPVAENLPYERYAAVVVRLPELAGVAPAQGYSRFYPAGPAVAHLLGYVGAASAKDYERDHNPLLITPGFKIGKEGLEKVLEPGLRGAPGARRAEVTARGRLVRELETRADVNGRTARLTVDAGLQSFLARRLGPNSGSGVVIDATNGDILAMVSMPAYDPNSFSDGISHAEWDMLSENDHLPLMNKTLQGLYPPGSTVKPMVALALLRAGVSPLDRVNCTGEYRVGTGRFHCHKRGGHGPIDLHHAIAQSCDIYFWTMARRIGFDSIAREARAMGLGVEFALPVASQRYGTVPDPAWKRDKYDKAWTVADTINAAIGQGYMLANPLQLAVMAARLGSGRQIVPRLLMQRDKVVAAPLDVDPRVFAIVRAGMSAVVNGGGTGGQARISVPGVLMAGKTGTAQVRRITMSERRTGVLSDYATPFRLRDHSLFLGFAPAANPRYACAVVLEHSGHIVTAAPIARDALTWLFDRKRAETTLATLEKGWGGDIATRMRTEAAEWRAARTPAAAPPDADRLMRDTLVPAPLALLPWRMILLVAAIGGFGLVVLYSAAGGSVRPWALNQGVRFVAFLGGALALSRLRERWIRSLAIPMYAGLIALLLVVELFGFVGGGSRRWLDLGVIRLQPSELMKPGIVLILARFYDMLPAGEVRGRHALWPAALLAGVPAALVMLQPDLGTALMIVAGALTMMFLAGVPLRLFVGGALLLACAAPIAFSAMHDYQRNRVLIFLDPESDPLGTGYHISQSKIAIGSGGLFGKGFLGGTQSHLDYLPEGHTDFVFATMAEEWGLAGGVGLIVGFLLVVRWGLAVGLAGRTRFARLTAAGLATTIFFYVAINLGMVMGLAPVVGIPLPLVSFGGSAMMTVLFCFGLLMALDRERRATA